MQKTNNNVVNPAESPTSLPANLPTSLIDPFGRQVTYLRLSLTDRCDFRCTYCMAEKMEFLPRQDLLSFEELERLIGLFIQSGIKKLRLTGGEPLVRRGIMDFTKSIGAYVSGGQLDELTLTTNGSQLTQYAADLYESGVRRVNVSLDTLDAEEFRVITRRGDLAKVLAGLQAAKNAGLQVKLNTVAMKGFNTHKLDDLIEFSGNNGFGLTLIEVMPMGDTGFDRRDQFVPLDEVKKDLSARWTLVNSIKRTGGPAEYFTVQETGGTLGFISPLTGNFCDGCNRIRLTCTGQLYLCLGQNDMIDFRAALRSGATDTDIIKLIQKAMGIKPKGHNFDYSSDAQGDPNRHMSVTGG